MSEISKARERIMLNKRAQDADIEERPPSLPERHPRKFTVSAFTHQIESKFSDMEITPGQLTRQNTARHRVPDSPMEMEIESRAKENTTPLMLKTINIKISDISKLDLPSSVRHLESQQGEESRFVDSPPKVAHTRLLHRERLELLVAPPQHRRHHSPYKPAETLLEYADKYIA